jgi:hypothetical protein
LKNYGLAILGSALFVSVLGYTLLQSHAMAKPSDGITKLTKEIAPPTADENALEQSATQLPQNGCPSDEELLEMAESYGMDVDAIRESVNASSAPNLSADPNNTLPYSMYSASSTVLLVGINGHSCGVGGTLLPDELENATYIGGPLDNQTDNQAEPDQTNNH